MTSSYRYKRNGEEKSFREKDCLGKEELQGLAVEEGKFLEFDRV